MGTDPIFQEDKHPVLSADRVGGANILVALFIEIKQRISLSQFRMIRLELSRRMMQHLSFCLRLQRRIESCRDPIPRQLSVENVVSNFQYAKSILSGPSMLATAHLSAYLASRAQIRIWLHLYTRGVSIIRPTDFPVSNDLDTNKKKN